MKENPLEGKKRSNSLNSPMASTPLEYEHGTRCQKSDYRSLGININVGSCSILKKKRTKKEKESPLLLFRIILGNQTSNCRLKQIYRNNL